MSEDPEQSPDSEVWPAYVRYPVIVVLAGVGLIGVITFVYDAGWLPLAGPFVAVVAASVIVFVVMWWRSRRLQRLATSAADQLRELGPAIADERRLPAAGRPTGPPTSPSSRPRCRSSRRCSGWRGPTSRARRRSSPTWWPRPAVVAARGAADPAGAAAEHTSSLMDEQLRRMQAVAARRQR